MVKREDVLYYVMLIGLMFLLPIGFAWHDISNWVIEFDPPFKDVFLNLWVERLDAAFVLWAVGVRLVLEGGRRIIILGRTRINAMVNAAQHLSPQPSFCHNRHSGAPAR